jgi:hypothetical protein
MKSTSENSAYVTAFDKVARAPAYAAAHHQHITAAATPTGCRAFVTAKRSLLGARQLQKSISNTMEDLEPELQQLLEQHKAHFSVQENGKILCTINGHTLPPRHAEVSKFIQ